MIHHVVAISAATTLIETTRTPPARAVRRAAVVRHDGGNHHGNGHHNRNLFTVRSPTHNRGYQHTNNGNAGGTNPVQNGLCRQVTVCTINQKVTIIRPEPPGEPAPATAPATELLSPQAVVPQTHPAPAPAPALTPRAPFIYMGPDGFMLMGGDSGAGFGGRAGSLLPFGLFG